MTVMKNKTFNDYYVDPNELLTNDAYFYAKWIASGFSSSAYQTMTETNIKLLYFLLSAKYGMDQIASSSEEHFNLKLMSIIFQYGSFWQKEMEIQKELRALELDETDEDGNLNSIYKGSKAIYNHSYNPSTPPSTDALTELTTIDDQNTTNYRKSRLEGLSSLEELLKRDVTQAFLERFKTLFKKVLPYTKYQNEPEI